MSPSNSGEDRNGSDPSAEFFPKDCTNRERAVFELGIKLGALYHLVSSFPVKADETVLTALERAVTASIGCQPFVEAVKVTFNRDRLFGTKEHPFDYDEISGKVLFAEIVVKYKDARVVGVVEYVDHLEYPLMHIRDLSPQK